MVRGAQMNRTPLLSICIPCYRAEQFLPVVLDALMPQVSGVSDLVEVIIADDSPDDATAATFAKCGWADKVRFIKNGENLGMSPNIVRCLTEHAVGEFVWIWSQHCILHSGALQRVLDIVCANGELDAFYVNFNCANFPEDFPRSLEEGKTLKCRYRANEEVESRKLVWQELLNTPTAYCTQTYAHLLRTRLARKYWEGRSVGREFTNARDTFAQCCTVAETMFGQSAFYIGDPVFTIYNGAQTWSSLEQRSRVYLMAFPELIRIYESRGYSGAQLKDAQRYAADKAVAVIKQMLASPNELNRSRILHYLVRFGAFPGSLSGFLKGFVASDCNWIARLLNSVSGIASRLYRYCFFQCRPARWYHRRVYRQPE
jgi:glycosyltransferase involved in cell wall biosynthesis